MKKNKKIIIIAGVSILIIGTIAFLLLRNRKKKSKLPNAKRYSNFSSEPVSVSYELEPLAYGKYQWSGTTGMPIDIYLKGDTPIFKKTPDGTTYCTGYTFAVCYVCLMNNGMIDDWQNEDVKKLHTIWNQADAKTKPKLCVEAISKSINGKKVLGKEVTLDSAKKGDFCQIWRSSGSGHSVIFLERVMKNGKVAGIKYYSSNGGVNQKTGKSGPGEATEYFTDSGGSVLKDNTYFARLNIN